MLMDKIGISLETLDGEDKGKMIAQCETERDEFEMAEITSPMEAKVLLKWWAVEKLSRQVILTGKFHGAVAFQAHCMRSLHVMAHIAHVVSS